MHKRRGKKRKGIDVGKFGWRPRWLRQEIYVTTAVLVVCLFAGAGLVDRYIEEGASPYMAAVISAVLVDLANDDRIANNVGGLMINPKLVAAAQLKANDMAEKGYFAHQTPDGYDSWHWFELVGYDYSHAGENLAVDFSESGDVEKAWMKSPTHRDNILNEHYTEIGIATAKGTYKGHATTFAVQMFGRPASAAVRDANASVAQKPVIETSSQVLGEAVEEVEPVGALAEQDGDAIILSTTEIPWWAWLAAQPKQTLQYAYYLMGLVIIAALFADMEWEIHRHHIRHAMKAGVMLATMSMLFIAADWLFFAEPILATVNRLVH